MYKRMYMWKSSRHIIHAHMHVHTHAHTHTHTLSQMSVNAPASTLYPLVLPPKGSPTIMNP